MKAFRNTGLEIAPSWKTIAVAQAYRKHERRLAKKTGEKPEDLRFKPDSKPTKTLNDPLKGHCSRNRCIATLLRYEEADKPSNFGGTHLNHTLEQAGLIQMIQEPTRYLSRGAERPMEIGALYIMTKQGRDFLADLRRKA